MKLYQNFNDFPLGDISNYCAAVTSIISNSLLIFATSQVKSYNRNVRIAMYYMAFWRFVFSVTLGLTSPVIKYYSSMKTMYIIKNGFTLPSPIGEILLVVFIVTIVMFCNGPTVQYLQVKTILKATSKQDVSFCIYLIPLIIGIPIVVLIYFGYIPNPQNIMYPPQLVEKMKFQGIATFLMVPMSLEQEKMETMALACTLFILLVMIVSIVFAIFNFISIQFLMKEKLKSSASNNSKKSQEQLNTNLLMQFIFPFFTIHTPFFITFALPFFDKNLEFLSDNMLYLSAWCPAANPIILMCVVKMMEHYTTNSWLEEANAGVAGVVSLLANILLIYLTTKVKTYSDTVRWSQYYSCCFRLAFSLLVGITAPTIMYLDEVKSLYIVKGGVEIHADIGRYLLNLFLVFVVTSCTGPSVQYLQVAYLLSNPTLKNHSVLRTMITLIPLFVAIPTAVLIFNGYTPNEYEMEMSKELIEEITGKNNSSFLIASEEKIFMATSGTYEYDIPARICTFFMFFAMIFSLFVVIVCFIHMQFTMKKKNSMSNKKSQKQLNLLLFVQFIFPFITIHIPFYTAFILPYLDLEYNDLSSKLPFMFAWCPAINPILVICMIKNVRDTLLNRKGTPLTGTTFTTSTHIFHTRSSTQIRK
ncbi:hypothetical protein CRE_10702 [Caenorhabditis remanei]|uniref:Uncharacterized protein n=1 Tax=Caenorhabditis remanei TaxID=31234 RepID=E3NLJ9_CAERE|nr:hypothetical protein CRE_10702 [Caenorhabditis remanei]